MVRYVLPVSRAIEVVEQHSGEINDALLAEHRGKKIHEIPWKAVWLKTGEVLKKNPAFAVDKHLSVPVLRPIDTSGQELYSYYEIGNQLMTGRVVSELKQNGFLKRQEDEGLFRDAVGRLYTSPPVSFRRAKVRALMMLIERLGTGKAEALVKKAKEVWRRHADELNEMHNSLTPTEKEQNPLEDMFLNPAMHRFFYPAVTRKKWFAVPGFLHDYLHKLWQSVPEEVDNDEVAYEDDNVRPKWKRIPKSRTIDLTPRHAITERKKH